MTTASDRRIGGPTERPPWAPWLSAANDITGVFLAPTEADFINMAGGLPAPELFDVEALSALARDAVLRHPVECLAYGPVEGLPALREALAARFSGGGLNLTSDNVLVTTGGMQALDLLGKTLIGAPGDVAAVAAPTYLGALDAWRPRAPAYRPLDLSADDVDLIGWLTGARFGYTVPNFSNPTGRLVDADQRRRLVDAAQRSGVWLVEDDPYGALYFDGPPLPRMIEMCGANAPGRPYDGPLVLMGTLSKMLAPGLRVGWVVASADMIRALVKAKQGSDMFTSGLTQRMVVSALNDGLVDDLEPRMIDLYRSRRDVLLDAMTTHLGDWFTWDAPAGGMFVWAVARSPDLDTDALIPAAIAAGVGVAPSRVFDPLDADRSALRINFTRNPPERLVEGVRRLAVAARALAPALSRMTG